MPRAARPLPPPAPAAPQAPAAGPTPTAGEPPAGPPPEPPHPGAAALQPAPARYLLHLRTERHAAARTLVLYEQALQRLQACCARAGPGPEGLVLAQVQAAQVRRFTAQLHGQGLSGRSLALVLSAWRGFYRWWVRSGEIGHNPVEGVRAPKAGRPLPKALPVDQAVALAEQAGQAGDDAGDLRLQQRDHAIVELLYGSGLRISELVGLDARGGPQSAGWIDLDDGLVHVLGKGRKRRSVPMGQPTVAALRQWLVCRDSLARADEAALFVGRRGTRLGDAQIRLRLKALAQRAGLPGSVHPHMLRHSFASHVLQSSGDLRGVQELLGHANISTTQVYTRLDFQHLARVYDAAHPRARKPGGR